MDRNEYLKRLQTNNNTSAKIAAQLNGNPDLAALGVQGSQSTQAMPLNLNTAAGPSAQHDYYQDLLTQMCDYIPNVDKVEEVLNILNDRNEHYIKQMALNFSSFQTLFRSLGKRRLTITELVDQIENALKEILGKLHIKSAEMPSYSGELVEDMKELDNQKILRAYLASLVSINPHSSLKEIFIHAVDLDAEDNNYFKAYMEYLGGLDRADYINKLLEELTLMNTTGFGHYPAALTKEFFATLVETVNSKMDAVKIGTLEIRNPAILALKSFPAHVVEHPEDPEKQASGIQAQIQTYLNDASTIALTLMCDEHLENILDYVDHYASYDDMAAKHQNTMDERQKYLDDKLHDKQKQSKDYENMQAQRNRKVEKNRFGQEKRAKHIGEVQALKQYKAEELENHKVAFVIAIKDVEDLLLDKAEKKVAFQAGHTKKKFVDFLGLHDHSFTTSDAFIKIAEIVKTWEFTLDKATRDHRKALLRFCFSEAAFKSDPLLSIVSIPVEGLPTLGYDKMLELPYEKADPLDSMHLLEYTKVHGLPYDKKALKKTGHGLHVHDQVIKNKYYVDTRVLGKGLLELRYTKNGHLTPFKSMTLDNDVHKVISDMIHKGAYNVNDYVKLPPVGKHMVAKFGGYIGMPVEHDDTFQQDFNITRGELASGNNNAVLKDKMKKMLLYAVDIGQINRHQMLKIWSDLKL
jgi:hypothetical protein